MNTTEEIIDGASPLVVGQNIEIPIPRLDQEISPVINRNIQKNQFDTQQVISTESDLVTENKKLLDEGPKKQLTAIEKIEEMQRLQKLKLSSLQPSEAAPEQKSPPRIQAKAKKGFFNEKQIKSPKINPQLQNSLYLNNQNNTLQSPKSLPTDNKNLQINYPTKNQHVDIQVFTLNASDSQWGIFDFSKTKFDKKNNITQTEESIDKGSFYENCNFQIKGTNYITRQSKYLMGYSLPTENIHGKRMGALSIIQDPQSYSVFQDDSMNVDFTTQIKRSDDYISQQLKDLSKKSYIVIGPNCELGEYSKGTRKKFNRKGMIVRQGDIIKFGRVPIMIKESSIDQVKWDKIQKQEQNQKHDYIDVEVELPPPSRNQYIQSEQDIQGESMNNLYAIPQSVRSEIVGEFNNFQPTSNRDERNSSISRERQLTTIQKSQLGTIQEIVQIKKTNGKRSCRICLCEEHENKDKEDPIISACSCKGSSGNIHLKCLQEWLNQKRKINKLSDFQENYIYKKSQCEVCGSLYPDMIEVGNKMFPIFNFDRPAKQNYIIIEVLGMPAGKNFSVVKIPDDYIIEIGRSGAEMNVPDVSVSKKQATIRYDVTIGELVVKDLDSKYGTHIMIQRPIPLRISKPVYLVNGLSLIKCELKKDSMNLCSCFMSDSSSKYQSEPIMYDECKNQMPEDLICFKNEENTIPYQMDDARRVFKDLSLHLMPLTRNAFYTKADQIDSQAETDRSKKEDDFYKGADVMINKTIISDNLKNTIKVEEEKKEVKGEDKEKLKGKRPSKPIVTQDDAISITVQGLSQEEKDNLLLKKTIEQEAKESYAPSINSPDRVNRRRNPPAQSSSSASSVDSQGSSYESEVQSSSEVN